MAKPFEIIYAEEDSDGHVPEWEWDAEELVFRSADGRLTLRPTSGVIERETEDEDESDEL